MNFDNPVYRKTTEDQFSLEKNLPARVYASSIDDEVCFNYVTTLQIAISNHIFSSFLMSHHYKLVFLYILITITFTSDFIDSRTAQQRTAQ